MGKPCVPVATLAGAVLAAVLAAGCADGGAPYVRPALEVPQAWSGQGTAAADWPDGNWWQGFGSEELDALVAAAQAHNHDLKAAAARVEQARAIARMAGAALYPSVTAGAALTRSRFSGSAAANSVSLGLGAAWDVDLWGANSYARTAAAAALGASRHGRDALHLTLTADVASAYLQVLALNDGLKAAHDNLANVRRLLAAVELQRQAGRISALELEQQRSAAASVAATIPALLQQRRATLDALALLTGRLPEAIAVSDRPLSSLTAPKPPLLLPAQLLERRPDIRQVEAILTAAHADVGAARAALLPRVQLSARGGAAAAAVGQLFDPGTGFVALGIDALATIFDAGRLSGQVDLSEARQRELVENYRQVVLSAFRDVEDALAGIEHFAAQEAAQAQALQHAREALRLAEIRYREGSVDFLAVLDAQRVQINADAALSGTRFQRFAALVALYRALGGGWQESAADDPVGAAEALAR